MTDRDDVKSDPENLMTDPSTEEDARIKAWVRYFASEVVEGSEEGMPLFGSASDGIRTDYNRVDCFGNLEDVDNLLSSGPAPAGHAVNSMQWHYLASAAPAVHPENVIMANSPLGTSATAKGGKLDATNLMEKGKSVMLDEEDVVDYKGALKTMKTFTKEQLAERFRKELLMILDAQSRQNSSTKAMEAKKQIASKASGDTNSVPHVGISSVTSGRVDEDVVTGEEGAPGVDSEEHQIVVPNPDFHDFDAHRTEAHVKKKQIWALYDGTDGMPRFYCQINKVVRYPFYVEGIWLEPTHPEKECFTGLKERGLSSGTGEFKLGEEVAFGTVNTFSHLMGSTRSYTHPRNPKFSEVYPKCTEVWAIYTDYEKDTSRDAEGKLKLRYEFVFMRSDFSRLTGEGRAATLQKLEGYNTLWTPDAESFQITVKDNLPKFSHRVPAVQVRDVQGVPCECLELDPASTSTDVFQT